MRNRKIWIPILAALALPGTSFCSAGPALQAFVTSCKADAEIDANERGSIDRAALTFVQAALGSDPASAYETFTDDAKAHVPVAQFISTFQRGVIPLGPYRDLRVTHTYKATVTGGGGEQRVVCGSSLTPDGWVAVNGKPGSVGHVLIEGNTTNNTMVFVVWLLPERGVWREQYVHVAPARVGGQSASDLRAIANTERKRGHTFNAFVYAASALQLADRGPFFQLGIRSELERENTETKRPDEFQGTAPWTFGKPAFKVLNVGPIAVAGKIYLVIDHEVESVADNKAADRHNRELIAALGQAYPEYKGGFAGVVVRAHERGGPKGYATVAENEN